MHIQNTGNFGKISAQVPTLLYMHFCSHGTVAVTIERLSMMCTANGKMKFTFCQNPEKLDLFNLLSCLLPRYIK